jgi:hypothetical protein
MSMRLGDRLSAARHRQFVGREGERELFKSALAAQELPFSILHVFGPGGVGKTTLLKEFAYLAEQASIPSIYVDARNVEPSPEAFVAALQAALGVAPPDPPLDTLAARDTRHVILVDTYESLMPLDAWLRESFLPDLPENVLIVLAGRQAPAQAWRTDPGWQSLLRVMPLRNLNPGESRAYLSKRNLPSERQSEILDFTHGHPLALSLVMDVYAQRGDVPFKPQDAPDLVRSLLEQLVQKVPGPAHRTALEACALVRLTTEELLARILNLPDAHDLFEWLRGLSFIESGRQGIFPHDLAREALVADLRWRNPSWYNELHGRARNFYAARLQESTGLEQQRVLFDYIFLHRDNSMVRPFLEWQEGGSMLPENARPTDIPLLIEMVRRHEGAESAGWVAFWFERQPDNIVVFRDPDGQPAGFVLMLAMHEAAPADIEADPATRLAWQHVAQYAPLRSGEAATHFRFWMARDTYQGVSATQSVILVNIVRHYLTTPRLVYSFFPTADADFWAPLLAYAEIDRLPGLDYEVGGHTYGAYGHNWRVMGPIAWLSLLADKEIAAAPQAAPPPKQVAPLVMLSEPEFIAALRDAFRDFTRPAALRANPLVHSRLVTENAGQTSDVSERVVALQALIRKTADSLQGSARDAKLYRVLHHTYFQPAATQEQAAELLDLPFSTYRRHLKLAVERVCETLWQLELSGGGTLSGLGVTHMSNN